MVINFACDLKKRFGLNRDVDVSGRVVGVVDGLGGVMVVTLTYRCVARQKFTSCSQPLLHAANFLTCAAPDE